MHEIILLSTMEEDSFFPRTGHNATVDITLESYIQVDKEK